MGYGDDSMALVVRERFELLENDGRPVRIKVVRRLVGEDDAMPPPKKSAGNNESALLANGEFAREVVGAVKETELLKSNVDG